MHRISGDTAAIHSLVTGASVNFIGDIITIIGVLIVLANAHWPLAVVTYTLLPLFVFNYLWHAAVSGWKAARIAGTGTA